MRGINEAVKAMKKSLIEKDEYHVEDGEWAVHPKSTPAHPDRVVLTVKFPLTPKNEDTVEVVKE